MSRVKMKKLTKYPNLREFVVYLPLVMCLFYLLFFNLTHTHYVEYKKATIIEKYTTTTWVGVPPTFVFTTNHIFRMDNGDTVSVSYSVYKANEIGDTYQYQKTRY